jgi:hypothetical protein
MILVLVLVEAERKKKGCNIKHLITNWGKGNQVNHDMHAVSVLSVDTMITV